MGEDSLVVRANMTPQERRDLHEVLGREDGENVPIAEPKTNGDQWHEHDPAALAILEQIQAACTARDEALKAYLKAEPLARRATSIAHGHWEETRRANTRALKLREVLDTLKAVPK